MSLFMVDQAQKHPHRRKTDTGCIFCSVIGLTALIMTLAILFAASSFATDEVTSVTGATYDNLLSPEMAEFTVLYGHGQEYEEYDLD